MDFFNRSVDDAGLHTVRTRADTVPELVPALDPTAKWVLLMGFTPIRRGSWLDTLVPMPPDPGTPVPVTIKRLSMDLLTTTESFLAIAQSIPSGSGLNLLQFRKRPRADMDYLGLHPQGLVAQYRQSELVLRIGPGTSGRAAELAALTDADLEAAMERMGFGIGQIRKWRDRMVAVDRLHPVSERSERARAAWPLYVLAREWLSQALRELPERVLCGWNAASAVECREMMAGLEEFARLCEGLAIEGQAEFIDGCRWHFEHYPHYLERQRHFRDYATYVQDRHGPVDVALPPHPRVHTMVWNPNG